MYTLVTLRAYQNVSVLANHVGAETGTGSFAVDRRRPQFPGGEEFGKLSARLQVIECAWAELETRVDQAQDLDEVVKAHDDFLSALMTRALLDPESRVS